MKFDARARFSLLVLGLALTGCGGTAAEDRGGPAATPEDAAEPAAPPTARLPIFRAPEGWTEVQAVIPPRTHTFRHEGDDGTVELSIYAWPDPVGGLENNISRWAGERAGSLTGDERKEFESGPYLVTTVFLAEGASGDDAHGASDGATFNAYIELPGAAGVWTVKATGPTKAMLAQRATLEAFVRNL